MKFFRLLKCDLYLSIGKQWKHLFLLVAGNILFCIDLYVRVKNRTDGIAMPDMQDYIFYIWGGMGRYSPSPEEPFLFPGIWICSIGYMLFLMLRYPKENLYETGQQLMIRSGGRICYWTAKCIMLVVETFLYFIISYGVIWIYTVLTGGTVFKNINVDLIRDYGRLEINENAINNLPVWLYLLPAAMLLLLATVQMLLSFVSGVSIAYFVMLVLLLSSAYQMTQVLPGNWGMLYRSCYVMKDGFSSEKMLIFCLVSCLLCWILGGIRFCRADVLKREELG